VSAPPPDAALAALLALVAAEDGLSAARACKRLGLSRSELQRLLVQLGPEPALGGLDLLEQRRDGGRDTLWLTPRARQAQALPPPLVAHVARRLGPEGEEARRETLAEESPVALLFNGEPHAVMLATPAQLEDFALGFALGEGIVERAAELRVLEILPRADGITLQLAIPDAAAARLATRRRQLAGSSGCGLCGAESLAAAIAPVRRVAGAEVPGAARLLAAFARLEQAQPWNRECGALHAAAALLDDDTLLVREDVGRHNALDKVIGALAWRGLSTQALLVTSRASYELVHKAAQAGVGSLAAVSAPTAFAARLAAEAGLALFGFARGARITRYA
jgi:formate dehydrogenase accessory protein FdhD